MLEIDLHSPVPVYEQILLQIRSAITGGELALGASLPPIRQLAADLEVNPATVAKAYQLLERDGIVRTAGRRGTFVHAEAGPNLRDSLVKEASGEVRDMVRKWIDRGLEPRDLEGIFGMAMKHEGKKETK